jgi:hypothetical protein
MKHVYVFGTSVESPVHVEIVLNDATRLKGKRARERAQRLGSRFLQDTLHEQPMPVGQTSVEDKKMYVDLHVPGVTIHFALDLSRLNEADEDFIDE